MEPVRTNNNSNNKKVKPVLIERELKDSFLDYAMSVIVSRALPDVRDGLKPVHRRILYTMQLLGFHYNKSYHKSVRVVGEVLGKFHPHGDQAVYNTMVGMVQDFSKRYPLLDGQGNWGSVDGDNAAAMRYTEIRMAKISQELLADIDKETVLFVPNFDESTVEPVMLPSKLPHLLVNGTTGIAVGMATSIPPHNLGEVVDACLAMLSNPDISEEELFGIIPAPDFPTGGIICGRAGIVKAYKTGRGNVILRGVIDIEETKKGSKLLITELPYQVNKADLAVKIADLVKNKVVDGITNIKDESDRKGMRLVIDIKRGEVPQVVLNQLYKHTSLQTSVSILMLALLDNRPIIFSLQRVLQEFIYHRKQVVHKRSIFELKKAKMREHILAGFIIALDKIDDVIVIIKKSPAADEAIVQLNKQFLLTLEQGKAILEMRLQRLTGLEQEKIRKEMEDIKKTIGFLTSIVENENVLIQEVVKELQEIKNTYADARKTRIEGAIDILTEADLIPDEEVVITLTMKGYIKRVPLVTYGVQHRGGKGKMGMASLEGTEDIVRDMFVTKNHDMLLFFTSLGRVYSLRAFEIPEASRIARGRAVINLLPLQEGEQVVKLLWVRELEGKNVVMVTKKGIIKRTNASDFAKIRATGIRALTLREDDELVFCKLSSGEDSVVLATSKGQGIRFVESEVRQMGRQAAGVIGIRLKKADFVVGMEIIVDGGDILFATEKGFGKKVRVGDFRVAHRGGVGVRTIPTDKRNGPVIGLAVVSPDSDILLIDRAGKIIRLPATEIRTMGRQAKGVRLIRLDKEQNLASIVAFEEDEPEEEGTGSGGGDGAGIQKDSVQMQGAVSTDPMNIEVAQEDNIEMQEDNVAAEQDTAEQDTAERDAAEQEDTSTEKEDDADDFEVMQMHIGDDIPAAETEKTNQMKTAENSDDDPFLEF